MSELRPPYALITGGAGFVGANLADRLAREGKRVLIFDSLARAHVEGNLQWLARRHGSLVGSRIGDVRDADAVREAVRGAGEVYHLAAQVAVTCSIQDPVADFEVNARGTLNVLEAIRTRPEPPPLVFCSTNKVYGVACRPEDLREETSRYVPRNENLTRGFAEEQPLDLHSPYGCSKGAADQYVVDYARIFGIPTIVFRMSCIYGPRQFGTEDQGWVAHFLRAALLGEPITIYGNGKQVRDLLFAADLVDALVVAQQQMPALRGRAFNIGGGARNTASLLEVLDFVARTAPPGPDVAFAPPRPGDQPWYVSDTSAFASATGWEARTSVREGLAALMDWLREWTGRNRREPAREEVQACASS
jgi:CDP-paratose 2-epimerase